MCIPDPVDITVVHRRNPVHTFGGGTAIPSEDHDGIIKPRMKDMRK
jgi:hypothetical protein